MKWCKVETISCPRLQKISYQKPALRAARGITKLGTTDILRSAVQVLADGARQGLHAHNNYDAIYMGFSGRVRFYGEGGALFAEIGPNEGVIVPRGVTYGFEAVGGGAEMFYVSAVDRQMEDRFFSHEPGGDVIAYDLFDEAGELLAEASAPPPGSGRPKRAVPATITMSHARTISKPACE